MPFAQLTLLDVLRTCFHKRITLLNPQLLKERGVLSHGFFASLCWLFKERWNTLPSNNAVSLLLSYYRSRFKFTFSRRFLGFGNRQSLLKDSRMTPTVIFLRYLPTFLLLIFALPAIAVTLWLSPL